MRNSLHRSISKMAIVVLLLGISWASFSQTTHEVSVTNNVYTPKDITIQAGDIVKWTNSQGFHNVNGKKSTYPNNPESFGNSTGTNWTYSYTFNVEGKYDYQCDPHVGLGMVGTVTVVDDSGFLSLKVNFQGMNPHVGQMFAMYVKNMDTGEYVDSLKLESIPGSDFDLETDLIESGSSYHIDFYSDHNGNGMYDAPPVDHAWRLEALNLTEDTEINFTHNTNFTNIFPDPVLTANFSSFNPHDGQDIWLSLIDLENGAEVYRHQEVVSPEFSLEVGSLEKGKSYRLDIYADHNRNGYYDAPPADHAWSFNIDDVSSDVDLDIAHNTNFTDIKWQHRLTVSFEGMAPHNGQMFTLYVKNQSDGSITDTLMLEEIADTEFSLHSYGILPGSSYWIDFYSDHNGNGEYDAPPADHAWRLDLSNVMGDTTLSFMHNTNFTDIMAGSTGIDYSELDLALKVFPNPVVESLIIEFEGNQEDTEISIINLAGQELKYFHVQSGQSRMEINMADVSPGIYFLSYEIKDQQKFVKIVKR